MDRIKLLRILQSYLGMQPQDKQCFDWKAMQEKMADEILALISVTEKKGTPDIVIKRDTLKFSYQGPMMTYVWEGFTTKDEPVMIKDTMYIELFVNDILVYEGRPKYRFGTGCPSHTDQMIEFVNGSNQGAISIE